MAEIEIVLRVDQADAWPVAIVTLMNLTKG